jgi:type II secretion system protein N
MQFAKRFLPKATSQAPAFLNSQLLYRIAGAGLFLLALLYGFYLFFPNAVLRQRLVHELEARFPIRVEIAEAGLRPLLTLTGEKAVVRSLERPEMSVTINRFSLSPFLRSLFTGDPAGSGEFFTAGGKLAFRCKEKGPLEIKATDLRLNIPLASSPEMHVAATLTSGQVITAVPLQNTTESLVDVTLDQVVVQGLETLTKDATGLHLGKLTLRMTGKGVGFAIERLEASGGDLVVTGTGTLLLAMPNPQNSRFSLNLSVRAGSQSDPTLASLLEFAGTKQPDGSRKIIVAGTLAQPEIKQ